MDDSVLGTAPDVGLTLRTRLAELDDFREVDAMRNSSFAAGLIVAGDRADYERAIARSDDEMWVVLRGDELVGHYVLGISGGWLAELRTLVVKTQRCGIGAFALGAMLRRAFGELGAQRAYLEVVAENTASRALCERAGFTLEGVWREGFRADDGSFRDLCGYGLLAREYRASR